MSSRVKKKWKSFLLLIVLTMIVFQAARAEAFVTTKPQELERRNAWLKEQFLGEKPKLPFSFTYGDKKSDELLAIWPKTTVTKKLDDFRTQHTLTWTDPKSGLEIRCVIVEYSDYPAVEWTAYFKNTGDKNTPILESIQGLNTAFQRAEGGEFALHGIRGDINRANSYQPYQRSLKPGESQKFVAAGGWGTCGDFPCYNLQMPGEGLIIAIGWPGQWASSFVRNATNGLQITAGQELTHMILKPGEEVRSPLVALLFCKGGDMARDQNMWRRWMVRHNLPRTPDGKLTPTQILSGNQGQIGFTAVTEKNQIEYIDLFVKRGISLDAWDIDAGWFDCPGDWWLSGTWEHDKKRFPNGLKPVSNRLHEIGAKLVVWFEPERVGYKQSWLGKNHPEWLLPEAWDSQLLNLGDLAARQWVLDHIDKAVTEYGIDFYRQDYNIPAIDIWRRKDTVDRQGITENLHVQGYLWWWDELRLRHPNLLLDCCASGGRRNDLETLRRAVPLHRTDYVGEPTSQQCHHFGLSQWIPYHGAGYVVGKSALPPPDCPPVPPPDKIDPYYFRSGMSPSFGLSVDVKRDDYDYKLLQHLISQYREVSKYYLCDFYHLSDYSLALDVWLAWQYDNPEAGEGVVQAFRRLKCEKASNTLRLRGLDPSATYKLTNLDTNVTTEASGTNLMEKGLTVEIKDQPGAAVILYKMKRDK